MRIHTCEIVPCLTNPPLLFTELQLLTDKIKKCTDMNEVIALLQESSSHVYPRLIKIM